jgi:hypothetical protein
MRRAPPRSGSCGGHSAHQRRTRLPRVGATSRVQALGLPLGTNCSRPRQRGTHACFPPKSERLRRQRTRRPQSRAAAWRARRTTLTRPRHTAPRVLPYACPAALTRSARGTPVVSDVILRVWSQTTDAALGKQAPPAPQQYRSASNPLAMSAVLPSTDAGASRKPIVRSWTLGSRPRRASGATV